MKKLIPVLLPVLSLIVFPFDLSAQEYWSKIQTPVHTRLNTIYSLDTNRIWVGADSGKVLFTSDKGETWAVYDTGIEDDIIKLFFLDENNGWGLAHYENFPVFRSVILKTTDGGQNWTNNFYRIENVFLYSIIFFDTTRGWIGGDIELAYTEDGGENWSSPPNLDSTFIYLPIYELKFFNERTGYAVGGYIDFAGVVWVTADSGKSWSSEFAAADPPYDVHLFSEDEAYALSSDIEHNYNIEVIRTTTGGQNWFVEPLSVYGTVTAIDFRTRGEGWGTMGRDRSALFTSDSGKTWDYYLMPDSAAVYDVFFIDSTNGFMAGDSGRFFTYNPQDPSSAAVPRGSDNSIEFALHQNYPNPFNSGTEITYQLSGAGQIRLDIFNSLGEKISTIAEGFREPGTYKSSLNATDLPSGIYFYRLVYSTKKETEIRTKKMILLK